tara:strand:+ start:1851 stop:2114 length:264 start_codon:yes stop_codon:yes gene_type:complete
MSEFKSGLIVFAIAVPVAICIGLWHVFLSSGVCEGIQAGGGESCDFEARGEYFKDNLFIFGFFSFVWIMGGVMVGMRVFMFLDNDDS